MAMGPYNNPVYLMEHLASVMGKRSEHVLRKKLGIGLSQYKILMVLEWSPRVSQRVIAESLGQTEASISRQVKAMAAAGLLDVRRISGNRRKSVVLPTPEGMRLTEAADDLLRRTAAGSGVDERKAHELVAGLQELHRMICRPGRTGSCGHRLGP